MTPSPPRSNAPVIVLVVCLVTAMIAAVGAGVAYSIRKQKERKEIETRVTPSSNANATDDLVDSDYRFTLRWPGKGFKILHEADAVRVAKNAKGALTHEGGCSLFVTAEYVPGAKLDSFADAITSSIALVDKKTLVREERTKWDRRGIELEVEGTTMGVHYYYENFMFERQGWFLRALFTRPETVTKCPPLDDALSFQDGDVNGRRSPTVINDEEKRLYRVRDGEYASPTYRLRLKMPANAALHAGRSALAFGADVALDIEAEGMGIKVISTSALKNAGATAKALLAHAVGERLSAKPAATVQFGGTTMPLYDGDLSPPNIFYSLAGVVSTEDRAQRIVGFRCRGAPGARSAPRSSRRV